MSSPPSYYIGCLEDIFPTQMIDLPPPPPYSPPLPYSPPIHQLNLDNNREWQILFRQRRSSSPPSPSPYQPPKVMYDSRGREIVICHLCLGYYTKRGIRRHLNYCENTSKK